MVTIEELVGKSCMSRSQQPNGGTRRLYFFPSKLFRSRPHRTRKMGVVPAPPGDRTSLITLFTTASWSAILARSLENDTDRVRLFTKLPRPLPRAGLRLETIRPTGRSSMTTTGRLGVYLVRETKSHLIARGSRMGRSNAHIRLRLGTCCRPLPDRSTTLTRRTETVRESGLFDPLVSANARDCVQGTNRNARSEFEHTPVITGFSDLCEAPGFPVYDV
jgi:hypothetical protein